MSTDLITEDTMTDLPRLNRTLRSLSAAPVRMVHLGLGAFHRSHQAWYTEQASDAGNWGIASFTGRRPDAALTLAAQDGLFTVVERADAGDTFSVVGSIVEAVDGADVTRLAVLLAASQTAVVTLTITEAAYLANPDGSFNSSAPEVVADLAALGGAGDPVTPLGRLVLGLAARRTADAGPLAVVCCDNLSNNGEVARQAVVGMANAWDPSLAEWVSANTSFVSTSVDRITPRTTPEDVAAVAAACGYADSSPVVAEPFASWVLSGEFPAGRPRWEDGGALFVEEIEPYENRKLWLLNGAHSLLAYAGQLRGHATVAEALADPFCRDAITAFWDEAEANLPAEGLQIPAYREALLARFSNARIAHHLAQISLDGTTKLRMRAVPVLRAERAAGRSGAAAALMIASWMDCTVALPPLQDPLSAEVAAVNASDESGRVRALLALVDAGLAADDAVVDLMSSLRGTTVAA